MKKVIVTKGLRPATVINIYYDTNALELVIPRPTGNDAELLLKLISNEYAAKIDESATIYVTRITKETSQNEYKLIYSDTKANIFSLSKVKINPKTELSNLSSKITIQNVYDTQLNGAKLPPEFSPNLQAIYKKGELALLAPLRNNTLNSIKRMEQPALLPPTDLPLAPNDIDTDNYPKYIDELNRRFKHIFINTSLTDVITKADRDQRDLQTAIKVALTTAVNPIETVQDKIANLLSNSDGKLNETNQALLKSYVESHTKILDKECNEKFNHLKTNSDILSSDNQSDNLQHLLKKYKFGNTQENLIYLKQTIVWALYQAATDSLKMIWADLRDKYGVKKASEFNEIFNGIAKIDDYLQITPTMDIDTFTKMDLSHIQIFLQELLQRSNACLEENYHKMLVEKLSFANNLLSQTFHHLVINTEADQSCSFTNATYTDETETAKLLAPDNIDFAEIKKPVDHNKLAHDIVDRHAAQDIKILTSQFLIAESQIEYYKNALVEKQNIEKSSYECEQLITQFDKTKLSIDTKINALHIHQIALTNRLDAGNNQQLFSSELSQRLTECITIKKSLDVKLHIEKNTLLEIKRQLNDLMAALSSANLLTDNNTPIKLAATLTLATQTADKIKRSTTELVALEDNLDAINELFNIPQACDEMIATLSPLQNKPYIWTSNEIDHNKINNHYLEISNQLTRGQATILELKQKLKVNLPHITGTITNYINQSNQKILDLLTTVNTHLQRDNTLRVSHMIVNAILNFQYWQKKCVSNKDKMIIYADSDHYQIPAGIKPLIEIIKSAAYTDWMTDTEKSLALLTALKTYCHENIWQVSNNHDVTNFYQKLAHSQNIVIPPRHIYDVQDTKEALSSILPVPQLLISPEQLKLVSFNNPQAEHDQPKGFFKRHLTAIILTTTSFAITGAFTGGLLGLISIAPTFGLGALITPVLAAIGFAGGALIGFTAGCVGSLITDHGREEKPVTKKVLEPTNNSYNGTLRLLNMSVPGKTLQPAPTVTEQQIMPNPEPVARVGREARNPGFQRTLQR